MEAQGNSVYLVKKDGEFCFCICILLKNMECQWPVLIVKLYLLHPLPLLNGKHFDIVDMLTYKNGFFELASFTIASQKECFMPQ